MNRSMAGAFFQLTKVMYLSPLCLKRWFLYKTSTNQLPLLKSHPDIDFFQGSDDYLKQARAAIENAGLSEDDRNDILDDLGKLTTELQKPEKNSSRIKRFLNHIKEISSTTAEIITSAASIAKFMGL